MATMITALGTPTPEENEMDANDDMLLRALGGATFGPNASLTLPSGERLSGDEAQALTAVYADAIDETARDMNTALNEMGPPPVVDVLYAENAEGAAATEELAEDLKQRFPRWLIRLRGRKT
jgi:hypothetical protein